LILRPERVDIERWNGTLESAVEGRSSIAGTVRDLVFVGTHRRFVVDISERNRLIVSAPNRRGSEQELALGDRVRLSWAQADAWIIPEP
jgi:ABC-type Fe3+/spermidine/putrescine transport system ATPase subunit